jgi:hypothetical protein
VTRQQNKYTVNRQSAPALPECRGFTLRASYLTDAVATARGSYYTGAVSAGEPPGRWHGAGRRTARPLCGGGPAGHARAPRALPRSAGARLR